MNQKRIDELEKEVGFLTQKIVLLQHFILGYVVQMSLVRDEHMCEECFYKLAEEIGIERELIEDDNDLFYVKTEGSC